MSMEIRERRMKLSDEDIKNILANLGEEPTYETDNALIYRTCCHNHEGGSNKLYYYKKDKIFKCYTGGTECNALFDIFTLIMKIKHLRDEDVSLPEAIEMAGFEVGNFDTNIEIQEDLEYLKRLTFKSTPQDSGTYEILDKGIIDRYSYNEIGLKSWLDEGIGEDALHKYKIRYDMIHNCIVIPNLDSEGNLVGIRGRFLSPDARAKYMPVIYNGKILSHSTGKFLYGYYENKETIKSKKIAVIFEGEKSVLKMETYYPGHNISMATLGKKITIDQLDLLLKLNINEVVLAYDKEYHHNAEELKEAIKQYDKIIEILKPFFNVSVLLDLENNLDYKDSPIDKGKEVFEFLMKDRTKR